MKVPASRSSAASPSPFGLRLPLPRAAQRRTKAATSAEATGLPSWKVRPCGSAIHQLAPSVPFSLARHLRLWPQFRIQREEIGVAR